MERAPLSRRKLFIGGISWNTTDEDFRAFFSKFGVLEDCIVMRVRETRASRGFGFVVYEDAESALTIIQDRTLELDGRIIDSKWAIPEDDIVDAPRPNRRRSQSRAKSPRGRRSSPARQDGRSAKKLFIGGLSQEITVGDLRSHFGKYGEMSDAVVMIDTESKRSRGFGFVTFRDSSSLDALLEANEEHVILGKLVDCSRASDKGRSAPPARSQGREHRTRPNDDYRASRDSEHRRNRSRDARDRGYERRLSRSRSRSRERGSRYPPRPRDADPYYSYYAPPAVSRYGDSVTHGGDRYAPVYPAHGYQQPYNASYPPQQYSYPAQQEYSSRPAYPPEQHYRAHDPYAPQYPYPSQHSYPPPEQARYTGSHQPAYPTAHLHSDYYPSSESTYGQQPVYPAPRYANSISEAGAVSSETSLPSTNSVTESRDPRRYSGAPTGAINSDRYK